MEGMVFKNREHAGRELAAMLEAKYKEAHPLILGVPRGGVEVAYYVARQLDAELSVVISKKLPFPGQPEFGFGAVAEEHIAYVSEHGRHGLTDAQIEPIIDQQVEEINRRIQMYRDGKPLPEMNGRTVIIVDDGIATGVTLVPVVRLCRKKNAAKIVLAAPVSGMHFDEHLHEADAIEVLIQPPGFYAVGQVYEQFGDFPDEELLDLLRKDAANQENIAAELRLRSSGRKE